MHLVRFAVSVQHPSQKKYSFSPILLTDEGSVKSGFIHAHLALAQVRDEAVILAPLVPRVRALKGQAEQPLSAIRRAHAALAVRKDELLWYPRGVVMHRPVVRAQKCGALPCLSVRANVILVLVVDVGEAFLFVMEGP